MAQLFRFSVAGQGCAGKWLADRSARQMWHRWDTSGSVLFDVVGFLVPLFLIRMNRHDIELVRISVSGIL